MRIEVNGVRLFFDVEGARLVTMAPSCARSRRRSCYTAERGMIILRSSRSSASLWTLHRSSTSISVRMAAATPVLKIAGT